MKKTSNRGRDVIYRAEIDGLRAIAVLSVILFHAGFAIFPGGYAGVDIFFVISGFLITQILAADLAAGRFSLTRFYERRARRILPALVVMVGICAPFGWIWMLPSQFHDFTDSVIGVGLFLSNFVFWDQSGYFEGAAEAKPLLHTWSLAVEEQFYVIFPLLLAGIWALGRRRVVWALALLALASLALAEWGWRHVPEANFYLIPFRAWELLAGSLCAFAVVRRNDWLAGAGLAMIMATLVFYHDAIPFPSLYALLPVAGTALVLLFAGGGNLVGRLLSWRPLVAIGLISYSAYLWHQPLFAFWRVRMAVEAGPWVMAGLSLLALGLGWLSWRYVETPFRRKSAPLLPDRKRLLQAAAGSMLLLVVLGAGMRLGELRDLRQLDLGGMTLAQQRELAAGRQQGIRSGKCHFNRDVLAGIDAFLAGWTCWNDDEPDLIPVPLGMFGDSHAADKAAAIRVSGFDLVQMTGAGCPLIITGVQRAQCIALLEAFHQRMAERGLTTVMLANRWREKELTPAYLQEVVDYWTARYPVVYLFSPTPTFPNFDMILLRMPADQLPDLRPDPALPAAFAAAVAQIDLKGVRIIDTYLPFCGAEAVETCAPWQDGASMLVDYSHLSAHGEAMLGARLVAQPDLPFAVAR